MPYKPELSCFIRRFRSLSLGDRRSTFTLLGGGEEYFDDFGFKTELVLDHWSMETYGRFHRWNPRISKPTLGISLKKSIKGVCLRLSKEWVEEGYSLPNYW